MKAEERFYSIFEYGASFFWTRIGANEETRIDANRETRIDANGDIEWQNAKEPEWGFLNFRVVRFGQVFRSREPRSSLRLQFDA